MVNMNQTRRNFIKSAGLGALGVSFPFWGMGSLRPVQNKNAFMMYVGTYTKGKSEGIYLYKLNPDTGELTHISTTKGVNNPSYLTLDPQRRYLYAVNEVTQFEGQKSGAISAFAVDQKTGNLTLLNQQPTMGGAPCYVTVDKRGKFVLAANYVGGNVAVLPIQSNGHLGKASHVVQHTGSSVNQKRQENPHAHCIVLDPGNRFAFAVDLGIDKVQVYQFDAKGGKLNPGQPASVAIKPGAGPRHLTFHPKGNYAYLINELDSTMIAFAFDKATGALKELQTISTLPADFSGESYCADVHVSPDGKFLYGSNRGHNSIAVFSIDERTGKLTAVEHVSTGGKWPRNFTLDPTGKFLLVANERSDNVVTFKVDSQRGKLTPTGQVAEIPMPVCLQMVPAFS